MGVRWPTNFTTTLVNTTLTTTTETVIATTGPINLTYDGALVLLIWNFSGTAGTAATAWGMRIRRGTTTGGTIITVSQNFTTVAGNLVILGGGYFDSPGIVAEQQYSLTMQQTAATGNGTASDVFLAAIVM